MYYAKLENNQIVRSHINVSDELPTDVGFTEEPTAEQLAPYGIVIVHLPATLPEFDATTHGLADLSPSLGDDGKWYANYEVVENPPPSDAPDLKPLPRIL
jgi:hypothetical protein